MHIHVHVHVHVQTSALTLVTEGRRRMGEAVSMPSSSHAPLARESEDRFWDIALAGVSTTKVGHRNMVRLRSRSRTFTGLMSVCPPCCVSSSLSNPLWSKRVWKDSSRGLKCTCLETLMRETDLGGRWGWG